MLGDYYWRTESSHGCVVSQEDDIKLHKTLENIDSSDRRHLIQSSCYLNTVEYYNSFAIDRTCCMSYIFDDVYKYTQSKYTMEAIHHVIYFLKAYSNSHESAIFQETINDVYTSFIIPYREENFIFTFREYLMQLIGENYELMYEIRQAILNREDVISIVANAIETIYHIEYDESTKDLYEEELYGQLLREEETESKYLYTSVRDIHECI